MADLNGVSRAVAAEPVSRCGLVLRGRRKTANSPTGVLGIGGDRSEVHDGGGSALSFGGGGSSCWWHSVIASCSNGGGATSSCSSSDQEAPGWLVPAWRR
jgi:hypothetical protein